eukprot:SM000104S09349  [mRNA]  locus=s104:214887:216389:- [translate_table: standard]
MKHREAELRRQRELAEERRQEAERQAAGGAAEDENGAGAGGAGEGGAPAAAAVTGEEAYRRRAMLSAGRGSGFSDGPSERPRSPSPPRSGSGSGGGGGGGGGTPMTAAEKMMAKMGWRAGQGLGKQEQGITTPLMARKTDKRAGVIVNASAAPAAATTTPQPLDKKPRAGGPALNGPPTRIVLLRNMVAPGEVDDELEDEVAGECAKYGIVTRVLVFEITEDGYPPPEAVRIFIQFERAEAATKALIDLDGRFFGGRAVKATFYDEDRFASNELAPAPGEPIDKSLYDEDRFASNELAPAPGEVPSTGGL